MKLELYKTLSREIVVNGRQHSVQVTISTMPDCDSDPFDMDFESEEEKENFRRKLENGALALVVVIVRATLAGETGTDSLWSCFVGEGYKVEDIVAEHGMIEKALIELENNLKVQHRALAEIFGTEVAS